MKDPKARCLLIESLDFENGNLKYKKILGPLKFRSATIHEWILHTMNVGHFTIVLKLGKEKKFLMV